MDLSNVIRFFGLGVRERAGDKMGINKTAMSV